MAITVPNVVKVTGSGVTTVTTSGVTTTTGSTFVAWTTADDGVTINAPTDSKSNSYGTAKVTVSTGGGSSKQTVYVKENGTGGSGHTLTFTFGAGTYPTCFFIECAGAATASYDSGSLTSGASGAGSPFNRNSGGQAQAANAILTFIATDAGGSLTYANSGYTVSQESDGNNYWTGAIGRQIVSQTSAVTSSWTVSASNGGTVTFAIKEASGSGSPYTLVVDPASYTLTAAAETVTATRALTISPASYAITAQAVNLAVGRVLSVSPASYTLSAAAETLTATRVLNISPAAYVLSAADVTLTYTPSARELLIDPASYAVSATDVSFGATRALSIDPASYSLTASGETLSVGRVLSVNPASYALSASAQTLAVGRVLSVDPVAYSLTLADVTLDYRPSNPELIVEPASYVLSLPDVEFEYGRSGGGRDDAKKKIRKRVAELNKKILESEALKEAQETTQVAVTKAKSAPAIPVSAQVEPDHWDEDDEEALMLLL